MLCNVTGTLYLPNGQLGKSLTLRFRRADQSVTAEYLGAVVPHDVYTQSDKAGQVDFEILTGVYVMHVEGGYSVRAIVPDAATADIADCIDAAAIPDQPPVWYQQALDARDEAVDAADRAEDAASQAAGAVVADYFVATDAQRLALSPSEGETAYVSQTGRTWKWQSGAWVDMGAAPFALSSELNTVNSNAVNAAARGDILMPATGAATANEVVYTTHASQAFINKSSSRRVQLRWPITNTSSDPVALYDGVSYVIKGRGGRVLAPGELVGGGIYIFAFQSISPPVLALTSAVGIPDIGGLQSEISKIESVENAQADVSPYSADLALLSSSIVQHAASTQGQTADFSGMTQTSTAGSRTMIVRPNLDARYANGGVIDRFEIYLTAPTRVSVSSWTADAAGTTYYPHAIQYFDGVAGYNSFSPSVPMPKDGVAAFGADTAVVGVNSSLPITYVRASSLDFQQFTQASTANFRFMYSIGVTEPTGILIPQEDIGAVPPVLIDKQFIDADGWTVANGAVSGGALVSGAGSSWAAAAQPTGYPYSQLSKHTMTAYANIVDADQVWGISSIKMVDGHNLDAPAAIVDGTDNKLKVYLYNGATGATPPAAADEEDIPWTVEGSSVRLDIIRDRFRFTVRLTNMLTGESVDMPLDYSNGTASNETTSRPWGRPCILFPDTDAGGVEVTRVRYAADYPFPSGRAAKVICGPGDSITEASQIGPDFDLGWAYLLEEERAANGSKDTVVVARGGQKSDGALGAVAEAVRLCDSSTVVVILIGTNDAGIASGTRATWRANVGAMIEQYRTKTQRIALCMLPPGPASAATKRSQINEDILNGYFPGLLPPVRFDLALSLNNDGVTWNPAYRQDATHPNVAGNAAMLERLRLDCPEAFE